MPNRGFLAALHDAKQSAQEACSSIIVSVDIHICMAVRCCFHFWYVPVLLTKLCRYTVARGPPISCKLLSSNKNTCSLIIPHVAVSWRCRCKCRYRSNNTCSLVIPHVPCDSEADGDADADGDAGADANTDGADKHGVVHEQRCDMSLHSLDSAPPLTMSDGPRNMSYKMRSQMGSLAKATSLPCFRK